MSFVQGVRMTGLMDSVRATQVPEGGLAVFFVGQAGFLLKTHEGHTVAIDPCLSDYCEEQAHFKRLVPAVCDVREFACDTLLISHEHADHFDADLIEAMATLGHVRNIMGPVSVEGLWAQHAPQTPFKLLSYGEKVTLPGLEMTPVFSDHGAETPHALGFLFRFGGRCLYYAGDTSYTPDRLGAAFAAKPEIAIMPINGEFGNLDAAQAYRLAGEMGCRQLVPCHYWMYAQHGSCPRDLLIEAERQPGPEVIWLALGEGWLIGR